MRLHDGMARRDGAYPNVFSSFHQRADGERVLHLAAGGKSNRLSGASRLLPPGDTQGLRETILVVDEDEVLRNLEKHVLASNGYKVLTAKDGQQAMKVFSRHRADIDLVFADIALPKLRGDRLLEKMRKINPQVRVIFAGGYVDERLKSQLLEAGAVECVQKPRSAGEIVAAVQVALNQP